MGKTTLYCALAACTIVIGLRGFTVMGNEGNRTISQEEFERGLAKSSSQGSVIKKLSIWPPTGNETTVIMSLHSTEQAGIGGSEVVTFIASRPYTVGSWRQQEVYEQYSDVAAYLGVVNRETGVAISYSWWMSPSLSPWLEIFAVGLMVGSVVRWVNPHLNDIRVVRSISRSKNKWVAKGRSVDSQVTMTVGTLVIDEMVSQGGGVTGDDNPVVDQTKLPREYAGSYYPVEVRTEKGEAGTGG